MLDFLGELSKRRLDELKTGEEQISGSSVKIPSLNPPFPSGLSSGKSASLATTGVYSTGLLPGGKVLPLPSASAAASSGGWSVESPSGEAEGRDRRRRRWKREDRLLRKYPVSRRATQDE